MLEDIFLPNPDDQPGQNLTFVTHINFMFCCQMQERVLQAQEMSWALVYFDFNVFNIENDFNLPQTRTTSTTCKTKPLSNRDCRDVLLYIATQYFSTGMGGKALKVRSEPRNT